MPSPRTPAQRGRNYTVNIRMSRDEIEAARKLGSGNISMGFRQAIRYAMDRDMWSDALPHQLTTESVIFAMLPTPPATRHIPAAHSSRHVDAVHAMRLHWLHHGTEPPLYVRADS